MQTSAQEAMRDVTDIPPLPRRRTAHPVLRAIRFAWTMPTNLIGHAAGRLLSGGERGPDIRSAYARATLYPIRMPGFGWVGAVTLGHAIVHAPHMFEGRAGRLVLVHELGHTRQHDRLGPLFLPLHISAQLLSAALWIVVPAHDSDPVHAYNPLEQWWLCLGSRTQRALPHRDIDSNEAFEAYLRAFGV